MKKFFLVFAFVIAYATLLGIGFECLLNLFGMGMALSLDGSSATDQHPIFIPFCLIVGLSALVALVAVFILNLKASERFEFTKKTWWTQMIIAAVVSIPMIKPFEMLFDFLQKTF